MTQLEAKRVNDITFPKTTAASLPSHCSLSTHPPPTPKKKFLIKLALRFTDSLWTPEKHFAGGNLCTIPGLSRHRASASRRLSAEQVEVLLRHLYGLTCGRFVSCPCICHSRLCEQGY